MDKDEAKQVGKDFGEWLKSEWDHGGKPDLTALYFSHGTKPITVTSAKWDFHPWKMIPKTPAMYLDATTSQDFTITYDVTWDTGGNVKFTEAPKDTMTKPEPEHQTYGISGEFQGVWFDVTGIDIFDGDSPVAAVMEEVLLLDEDEELLSISVRKADGTIEVRPWTRS